MPAFRALIVLVPLAFGLSAHAAGPQASLMVLAASSLTDVLPPVAKAWKKAHPGVEVKFSFDGTSRLAAQIDQGVPADLFFSADTDWMDHLGKDGKLLAGTRQDLLKNEIVLIVPVGAPAPESPEELKKPVYKRIALADENVPISKYARAAFESLHLWEALQPKVVRGENVRTSLKWVDEKEVDAGVVYRTDALADKNVKVAFPFAQSSYPPVVYPAAVLADSKTPNLARSFLEFCRGPAARRIFKRMGFR